MYPGAQRVKGRSLSLDWNFLVVVTVLPPAVIVLVSPDFLCFILLVPFVFHIKEIKNRWQRCRRVDMIQYNIF